MTELRATSGGRTATALSTIGFLALAVGLAAAHMAPAADYEVSIYAATPTAFWAAVGVALLCGLVVGLRSPGSPFGPLLGGLSLFSVVSLPLIRDYRYYGGPDALTHLGWTRDLAAIQYGPPDMLYPGLHTTALYLSGEAGTTLTRSHMVVVLAMILTFVLFVPLLAWRITGDRRTTVIAAFSALLLLPINNVSTHLETHPVSMAILFSAAVLYVALRYMAPGEGSAGDATSRLADVGLFAVLAVAAVLFHPQLAFTVLLVLGAIAAVQYLARLTGWPAPVRITASVVPHATILGLAFLAWTVGRPRFEDAIEGVVANVVSFALYGQPVAAEVGERGASLAALGSGLPEILGKLFLVSAVYAALAAGLVGLVLLGRLSDARPRTRALVLALGLGAVPVVGLTLLYLLASIGTQAFRYAGFVMVPATVLGAIALGRLADVTVTDRTGAVDPPASGTATGVAAVVLAVALVLSVPVLFPSPFIYQPTHHVTDKQLAGYEQAFEYAPADSNVFGVREGPWRYADAAYGRDSDRFRYGGINGSAFENGVADAVPTSGWYLVLSDGARDREVRAYEELRYSGGSFDRASHSSRTSRVMSNGGVELYVVSRG